MLNRSSLSVPTAHPALPDLCTVVLADVSQPVIHAPSAIAQLSQAEIRRANSFRSAEQGQRYVQCHALLRTLLSERIGLPGNEIIFTEESFGKPVLSGVAAESDIRFNISHTGALVVIAISEGVDVGVDIERRKPGRDIAGIAEHFFATSEQEALQKICMEQRDSAFLSCWCRKESFVKAIGRGLQMPLDRFAVNVDPDAPATLVSIDDETLQLEQWQMHTLIMPAGYFGALTLACA